MNKGRQVGALNPIPVLSRLTSLARILTLLPEPRPRYRVERPHRSPHEIVYLRFNGSRNGCGRAR